MDINVFLGGLIGSLVGGVILAGTAVLLYVYERQQANKKADMLVGDLKAMYAERLGKTIDSVYSKPVSSVKMN